METLLWIVSTALMLAMLGLLAFRAYRELLAPAPTPAPAREAALSRFDPAGWPWPVISLAALAILWLGVFLAHIAVTGGAQGFFSRFWERFTTAGDSPHYLYIAENGYVPDGKNANNIVFYPLLPLLMRGLGAILGGRTALAGLLISQLCYALSAPVMAALAKKECAHPGAALLAYVLYPFGFFCLGVFTEGLFLFLTLLGLWLIRERRWLWAGAVGFLCALTRTQGILLLLPGAYCALRDLRRDRWDWKYLALFGPLLGFGAYLCLNKAVCGSFFAYQHYESIEPWWQTPQWLGDTIAQQLRMAVQYYDGLANWIYWPQLALYFIAAALLMAGYSRGLDTAQLLYGTAYLGMCYTASWLISGSRYMLGCVPMYLAAGRIKNPGLRALILLCELAFCGVYFYWYMQGQAIM